MTRRNVSQKICEEFNKQQAEFCLSPRRAFVQTEGSRSSLALESFQEDESVERIPVR